MTDFMDPMTEQRVNFGTRDDDTMPLTWASKALTWLKANRPLVFADMMTEGVFGIEKTRGRNRS
jgi:hypothetical protein